MQAMHRSTGSLPSESSAARQSQPYLSSSSTASELTAATAACITVSPAELAASGRAPASRHALRHGSSRWVDGCVCG